MNNKFCLKEGSNSILPAPTTHTSVYSSLVILCCLVTENVTLCVVFQALYSENQYNENCQEHLFIHTSFASKQLIDKNAVKLSFISLFIPESMSNVIAFSNFVEIWSFSAPLIWSYFFLDYCNIYFLVFRQCTSAPTSRAL